MRSAITVFIGACLFLYGAKAIANGAGPGATLMVDVTAWLQIITGLVVALIGAYAKGLSERVSETKRELDTLRSQLNLTQVAIASEHHTKEEANAQFQELKAAMNALHRRLDFFQLPRGPSE